MEQPEKNFPSPSAQSFAGLLASLAAPEKNGTERATGWDEEELADDLVALSYEHALRAQATREAGLGESSDAGDPLEKLPHRTRAGEHDHASSASLRTASVTIRLSHLETARLRRRAAEAGLTVSAYVRSCVLETDALRAQVKEALAEMKTAVESTPAPTRERWTGWMGRIRRRR
jgi:hypothetical protein